MDVELIPVIGLGVKLAHDVLGPSAKYIGEEGASWTEAGAQNIKRVFQRAYAQLQLAEKSEGTVPPRVLKDVLQNGYFCEDELTAAYLGGVLASSKGNVSRDDRAVSYLAIINGLSTYQIRTHFLLYSSLLRIDSNMFGRMFGWLWREMVTISISEEDYLRAMDFGEHESVDSITHHCFVGLQSCGLVEKGILVKAYPPDGPFRFFYPTPLGVELFMWGIGCGDRVFEAFTPELLGEMKVDAPIQPIRVDLSRVSYA